jgi:hypothetical protein
MATRNPVSTSPRPGSITVTVSDVGDLGGVLSGAFVSLYRAPAGTTANTFDPEAWEPSDDTWLQTSRTDGDGQVTFPRLEPGLYVVKYEHHPDTDAICAAVTSGCAESVCLHVALNVEETTTVKGADCQDIPCPPRVGDRVYTTVGFSHSDTLSSHVQLVIPRGATRVQGDPYSFTMPVRHAGRHELAMTLQLATLGTPPGTAPGTTPPPAGVGLSSVFEAEERPPTPIAGNVNVAMTRTETEPTSDLRLWAAIRASTDALSFDNYYRFMQDLFCSDGGANTRTAETAAYNRLLKKRFLPFTDTDAYRVMKAATEAFVIVNCGVFTGEPGFDGDPAVLGDLVAYLDRRDLPRPGREPYLERVDGIRMLPYLAIIRRKLPDVPINDPIRGVNGDAELCDGFVQEKLRNPCLLELIWSYWHEEGLLVQTMNAISRRFQNVRGAGQPDPLANMEINPLRPLNNLLWGYIQDEQHRLTVLRRHGEYHHHYGLQLEGRAVQRFRPADTRSTFIEAFHRLLRLCTEFYKQDDQTTVKADAFGVLNALKEVHLILSQGAHSQFGDLPPTARIEMLMQQWLLSRPEFREFLPTRVMVAYPEPWMDRVDAMKKVQGWHETSVMHFHTLAVMGEQILLSIRYGAWSTVFEPTQAFNFARFWRPQVQGYIHAYRAATGVELGAEIVDSRVDATLPSVLLQRRLAAQHRSL